MLFFGVSFFLILEFFNDVITFFDLSVFSFGITENSFKSSFAINLIGCGSQCQPPMPAASNNRTNNIFFCVILGGTPCWDLSRSCQALFSI